MNTAISNSSINYRHHAAARTAPMRPMPLMEDLDDVFHLRILPKADLRVSAPLPVKDHAVLDVDRTVVPTSLIRRIEHELRNDECDPRTVFNFCRGLTKGSLEFEDAYIAARMRSFAKQQRVTADQLVTTQPYAVEQPVNARRQTLGRMVPAVLHPMAVNHLGHLMSHYGIWVIGLLGIQMLAAWRIGIFANTYLEGGRIFYFLTAAFLILALDSAVWFRRRGNLCNAFLAPGAVLFLMALLPILVLHLRQTVLTMR